MNIYIELLYDYIRINDGIFISVLNEGKGAEGVAIRRGTRGCRGRGTQSGRVAGNSKGLYADRKVTREISYGRVNCAQLDRGAEDGGRQRRARGRKLFPSGLLARGDQPWFADFSISPYLFTFIFIYLFIYYFSKQEG